MGSPHRLSGFVAVAFIALVALGISFFGSGQTGMASGRDGYLIKEVEFGREVAMAAAETCYPIRKSFDNYRECCDPECTAQCNALNPRNVNLCRSVCQEACTEIMTSIYLKRRPGFVGSSSSGLNVNQQYVIYGQ